MKKFSTAIILALAAATSFAAPARNPSDTGHGFYVSGTKVYKPDGTEFRIRGTNYTHYDGHHYGVNTFKMSAVRGGFDFTKSETTNYNYIQSAYLANGFVPIISSWTATCKVDVASLNSIVDAWVAQAATWTKLNDIGIINIANEWGAKNSTDWRDAYISAVQRMRAAGYTGLLSVDAGYCGQDVSGVVNYGQAIIDADPLHNILFDVHVYGLFAWPKATASWQQDYTTATDSLFNSGLPFYFGEFGPGRNIGPSPTMLPPDVLVKLAEDHQVGWLSWSLDANDLPNCGASEGSMAWVTNTCKVYPGPDVSLTTYGTVMKGLLEQYTAPPPVNPVLTTNPQIWCRPSWSCYKHLTATSPIGAAIVKWGLVAPPVLDTQGNLSHISISPGLLAWWSWPATGTYQMTLILTDDKGNISYTPITLVVSTTQPAGTVAGGFSGS